MSGRQYGLEKSPMRSGWSSARLNALFIITSVSEWDRWNLPRPDDRQPEQEFPTPFCITEERGADGFSGCGKTGSQQLRWRLASTPASDWSVSPRFCELRRPIRYPDCARLTRQGTLGDRKSPRTADVLSWTLSRLTSDVLDSEFCSVADTGTFSLSSSTGENSSPESCLNKGGFPGTTIGDFMSPRNSASSAFSRLHGLLYCTSSEL